MGTKRVYPEHFDIDGIPIKVATCEHCGNQVRKDKPLRE